MENIISTMNTDISVELNGSGNLNVERPLIVKNTTDSTIL